MRGDPTFNNARDELFAHVNRCNVIRAAEEQQREWMEDTMDYMAERFPSLSKEQLEELRQIGLRFCAPVIPHGKGKNALTVTADEAGSEDAGSDEAEAVEADEPVEAVDDTMMAGSA